ncbi:MAG: hypothetical protein FWC13_01360 [Oscillospiraceae bacterium]|nr:hypothetical protein [Oscillospiraceae bacterium]
MIRYSTGVKRVFALVLAVTMIVGLTSFALGAVGEGEPPHERESDEGIIVADEAAFLGSHDENNTLGNELDIDSGLTFDNLHEENLSGEPIASSDSEAFSDDEAALDDETPQAYDDSSPDDIFSDNTPPDTATPGNASSLTVSHLEIIAPSAVVHVGSDFDELSDVQVRVFFTDTTWEYGILGQNVNLTYELPNGYSLESSPAQWQIRYDASLRNGHTWNSPDDRATHAFRLVTVIDPDADMGAHIVNINGIDIFDLGLSEGRQFEVELFYTPLEHQHDKGRYVRLLLPDFLGFEFSVIPPQTNTPFKITEVSLKEVIIKFDDGSIPGESLIPISFIHRVSRELSQTPIPPSFEVIAYSYRGLESPPDKDTAEPFLHETSTWEFSAPVHPISTLRVNSFSPANAHAVITTFSPVAGVGESTHTFTARNLIKPAAMRSTQDNTLRVLVPVPEDLDTIGVTPIAADSTTLIEVDGNLYWRGAALTPSNNPGTGSWAFMEALWGPPRINTAGSTANISVNPRFRGVTNEIIQNPRSFTSERPVLVEFFQAGELQREPLLNKDGEPQTYTVTFGRFGVADFDLQAFNQVSTVLESIGSRPFRVQGTSDGFPSSGRWSSLEFRPTRYTNSAEMPQVIYEDMVISLGPFVPEMRPIGVTMNPRYGEAHFEYTLENGDIKRSPAPAMSYRFDVGDSYVRSVKILPVEINVQNQGAPVVNTLAVPQTWVFRLSSTYLRHDTAGGSLASIHPANFDVQIDSEQHGLHRPTRSQNFDLRLYHEVLRYDCAMTVPPATAANDGWQGDKDNLLHFWPRINDMNSARDHVFNDVSLRFTVNPAVNVRGILLRSGVTNEENNITVHFSEGGPETHILTRSDAQADMLMFTGLSSTRYVTRIDFNGVDIQDNLNVDGSPLWSVDNPHFTLLADYSYKEDLKGAKMHPRHESRFGLTIFLDGSSTPFTPVSPTRGDSSNLSVWLNSFYESDFSILPRSTHFYVFPEESRHTSNSIIAAFLTQERPQESIGVSHVNNGTLLALSDVEFVLNAENTSQEFLKSLSGYAKGSNLPDTSVVTFFYTLNTGEKITEIMPAHSIQTIRYANPTDYITELRITITDVPQRERGTQITVNETLNRFSLIQLHINLHRYKTANNGIDFEKIGVTDTLAPVSGTVKTVSERGETVQNIDGNAGMFIVPWGNDLYVSALGLNHTLSRVGENPPAIDINMITGGFNNPTTGGGQQTTVINNPGFWPGQTLQVDVRNILSAAFDREGHDERIGSIVREDSLPRGFAIRPIYSSGVTHRSWVGTATNDELTNVVVYIPVEPGFSLVPGTMKLMRNNSEREGAVRDISVVPSPEGTWLRVDLANYRPSGLRGGVQASFISGALQNTTENFPGTNSLGGAANFTGGDILRFELRASDFIPWDTTGSRPVIRGQYYVDVANIGFTGKGDVKFYSPEGLTDNDGNRFISGGLKGQNEPPASMVRRNVGPVGSSSLVLENTNPLTIRFNRVNQPSSSSLAHETPYHFPDTSHKLGDLRVRINAPSQQVGIFGLSTVGGDNLTESPNNDTRYHNHESVGVTVRASHISTFGVSSADYMIYVEVPKSGWGNLTHPGLSLSGPAGTLEAPPNNSSVFEYTVTTNLSDAMEQNPSDGTWLSEEELLKNFSWKDVTMVRISVTGVGNHPFLYNLPMENRADKSFLGDQKIVSSIHFRSPQIESNALRSVQALPTFTLTDYTVEGFLWHDEMNSGQMDKSSEKITGAVRMIHPTNFVSAWIPATPEGGFSVKVPVFNPEGGSLGAYRLEVAAPGFEPLYVNIDGTDDSRFNDQGDGTGYRYLRVSTTRTTVNAGFKESPNVSIVYLNVDGTPHAFDVAEIGTTITAPLESATPPGSHYDFMGWIQSDSAGEPISTHTWQGTFSLTVPPLVAPIEHRDVIYFVALWKFNPPLAFSAPSILDYGVIRPQFGTNFIELPSLPASDDRPAQDPATTVNFHVSAGEHIPSWRIDVRHDTAINLRHREHSPENPKRLDPSALSFIAGNSPIFGASQKVYTYNDADKWQDGVYTINWLNLQNRLRIRTSSPLIEVDTTEKLKTPINWIFIPAAP